FDQLIGAQQERFRDRQPEPLGGEIEAPFPIPDTVLQRAADAAVGAARGVEFRAAIGETVLHLEAYRVAERVETEGRIVGPHVGAADSACRSEKAREPPGVSAQRLVSRQCWADWPAQPYLKPPQTI